MILRKSLFLCALTISLFSSASATMSVSSTSIAGSSSNPLLIYLSELPYTTTVTTYNPTTSADETIVVTRTSISASFRFTSSSGATSSPTLAPFVGAGKIPYTYILRNAFPYGAATYTLSYYSIIARYAGTYSTGEPYITDVQAYISPALSVGLDAYKFTQNKITVTFTGSL